MTITPADPMLGLVLDGKYQIQERIGAGGMGAVYRALHMTLAAPRAIKVMRRELAEDAAFVERFQNEARLAEGLRHPNLVALYDFARLPDGTWYIVSELVEGRTLAELLQPGVRFRSEVVARVLGQICDGLAIAHRKGIVHRDISPDNLMIARGDGREPIAKLLDFGIAKDVVGSTPSHTGSSLLLGKIGYASPEQLGALSMGETIDTRTDVFSLAAVAYQMLTGELPWQKDTLQSYVHDLLVRPETEIQERVRETAPIAWREVFVRAFARQREARTPSMQAFRADMAEAARRIQTAADALPQTRTVELQLPPSEPTWRKGVPPLDAARHLGLWMGLAGTVLVGVLVAGWRFWGLGSDRSTPSSVTASVVLPSPRAGNPVPVESALPVAPSAPTTTASATPQGRPEPTAPKPVPTPVTRAATPGTVTGSPTVSLPSTPPPTPQPATLVVRGTPEAAVTLDGQPRGRTPLTLSAVPPGRHALALTSDDGRTLREEADLVAGERLERDLRFPGFGSLSVSSNVWAEVSVDGGPAQQTPFRVDRLMAGRHVVRATRPGFKEQTHTVEITEGDTSRLEVKLEKQ